MYNLNDLVKSISNLLKLMESSGKLYFFVEDKYFGRIQVVLNILLAIHHFASFLYRNENNIPYLNTFFKHAMLFINIYVILIVSLYRKYLKKPNKTTSSIVEIMLSNTTLHKLIMNFNIKMVKTIKNNYNNSN